LADKIDKKIGDKAEDFLDILVDRIEQLLEVSRAPIEHGDLINFEDYQKFREMMGECLSFLIIIERRIEHVEERKKGDLVEQFDQLTVAIWSILLDGSLEFLNVICKKEFLPIGTQHVFVNELKTLHDAEQILKREDYTSIQAEDVTRRRKTAEKILTEIIERAPQLLNLSR